MAGKPNRDSTLTPSSIKRRTRRTVMALVLVLGDGLAVLTAGLLASYIRFGSVGAPVDIENTTLDIAFWQLAILMVPLWVASLGLSGLYDLSRRAIGPSEIGKVVRALSLGLVVLILVTYATKVSGLSRVWTLLTWMLAIALVVIARLTLYFFLARLRRKGKLLKSTVLVGSNAEAADLARVVRSNRQSGLLIIGRLESPGDSVDWPDDIPSLGRADQVREVAERVKADSVLIASSAFAHDVLARMIAQLRDLELGLHVSSGLFEVLTSRVVVSEMAGIPMLTVRGAPLTPVGLRAKRVFDVISAATILVMGLPVWMLIAALIKLSDGGPVFFSQTRIGRDSQPFKMIKFRSMYVDAEARLEGLRHRNEVSGPLFKMKEDPRITPVGKWLRKFSLDEFPQLINVIRGDMSMVGPRPPLPQEVAEYVESDLRRLEVLPGITGLWQVSGRSSLTFEEMMRLDLFYIENWSLALDLALLIKTIPAVLLTKGAY